MAAADTWTAVGSSLPCSGPGAFRRRMQPPQPRPVCDGPAQLGWPAGHGGLCAAVCGWAAFVSPLRLLPNSGFSQVSEGSFPLLLSLSPIFTSFPVFSSSAFPLALCSFCSSLAPSSRRSPSAFRASRILSPPSAGISFPPDSSPFGTAALRFREACQHAGTAQPLSGRALSVSVPSARLRRARCGGAGGRFVRLCGQMAPRPAACPRWRSASRPPGTGPAEARASGCAEQLAAAGRSGCGGGGRPPRRCRGSGKWEGWLEARWTISEQEGERSRVCSCFHFSVLAVITAALAGPAGGERICVLSCMFKI